MESKKIGLLGWYGHGNCGDEMFKEVIPSLFPGNDFIFFSELSKNIKYINNHDFLIIGGGNIIDSKFLNGIEKIKVPYSFLGVGINENTDLNLLSGAKQVFFRDKTSHELAKDKINEYYLMPDVAFSMSPDKENGKLILKDIFQREIKEKTIGIFLNDCVNTTFNSTLLKFSEINKFVLELARFLDKLPYNILFIPMSFLPPDDRRLSFDVIGNMKNGYKAKCVVNPLTPRDCLDLTSALDLSISMRLHSTIFSTICGVPFIDITHHSKSKSYLENENLTNLSIDYYEMSIKSLEEKIKYVVKNYEDIKKGLLLQAKTNNNNLHEIIKNVHLP